MKDILEVMEYANYNEIQELMCAIQNWYASAFPDWDVVYLAVPRNDIQKRKQLLKQALEMLEREKR